MRINRVILAACLIAATAWAVDVVQTRIGTGQPSSGQLQPGEMGTDTNAMDLYIGDSASNAVRVGRSGVASTSDINTAVAGYLPTNTVFGITTNLSVLDLSTNSLTLFFTNGTLQGISSP
jgi:hypothetical protein